MSHLINSNTEINSAKVVIGLGFGDEGKGHVVDWLSKEANQFTVVRYSGGHQAAHCVRGKDFEHIFSNFGSGTFRNLKTFWDADTCDPVGFANEFKILKEKKVIPILLMNSQCPVTTPYEKLANWKRETELEHGSVGVGIGQTIQREEDNYHLYALDLFYPSVLKTKMRMIDNYYDFQGEEEKNFIKKELEKFYNAVDFFKNTVFLRDDYPNSMGTIFESSQGLMLDMDYGFFPHVTRSRVGTQNIPVNDKTEFYLVTRAYQTRHGNGPREKESIRLINTTELNEKGEFQGEFLSSALNLDLLKYALKVDRKIVNSYLKYLVITCLDQMKEWKLVHQDEVKTFESEKDFIEYILKNINTYFPKVFLSYGPTAEDIKEYRK